MSWNEGLFEDQERAASHIGSHSRLLAGPGTGKTLVLTRRVSYLIHEQSVPPNQILSLTFTRAAAQNFRREIVKELGEESDLPRVYTLHSFALRQLLKNSDKIRFLPQPLRIADDWEEKNIIMPDLKRILSLSRLSEVEEKFNQLSANWQSLSSETPDPQFIGAWNQHKDIFGYTLRLELVYQLKKSLEQIPDFELEAPLQHLLVDEYQDLNMCDLAIIKELTDRGLELFIAGDDDQSIYGFRKAYPEGIRAFLTDYPGSISLPIEICIRCDSDILRLAEFVANLDPDRIKKGTKPQTGRDHGEVVLLNYENQNHEAQSIVRLCKNLIENEGFLPSDILILSRVNTHNAFSRVLEEEFERESIPFSFDISSSSIFDDKPGRICLSVLRLLRNPSDNLSWLTILRQRPNRIGEGTITKLSEDCRHNGKTFSQLIFSIRDNPNSYTRIGNQISNEVREIEELIQHINDRFNISNMSNVEFSDLLSEVVQWSTQDTQKQHDLIHFFTEKISGIEINNLAELLSLLESANNEIEQEINPNSINMLTMHKAKGLSSKVVIIIGVEDELIPGRQETEPLLGDERRLLFVSLSRAKHKLFITYCTNRIGQQMRLGRSNNTPRRQLSRFLHYAPIHPTNGINYVNNRNNSD